MTDQNNAAQPGLTDDEINAACGRHAADTGWHAENDRKKARAVESALLSKLRAEGVQAGDERETFEEWDRLFTVYCGAAQGVEAGKAAEALIAFTRAALASAPVVGEAQPVATLHDDGYYTWHGAKPQGYEQAGWRMKVYAAPQASEAVRAPDYTLQHADHMAVSAERLMEAVNNRDAVIMQREESDDVDNDTLWDQHETVSEYLRGMREAIYEYRKRRNRDALAAQKQGDSE